MFANLKVRTKLIILTAVAAISMCMMGILNMNGMDQSYEQSVASMKQVLYDDYDAQIKGQVENVIALLNEEYKDFQEGICTEEEAKTAAADLVRGLRYGDSGYFWIDTYEGDNVVLLGGEVEGTNRLETKDSNGYQMIKDIIQNGRQADGGFRGIRGFPGLQMLHDSGGRKGRGPEEGAADAVRGRPGRR